MAAPGIGRVVGPYVLVDELGRGGMAIVYKARQASPRRFVALKILSPDLVQSPEFVARFRHEANIAASVDHPNVVPVYSVGEADGYFYIAMRLISGQTLRTLLQQEGKLPLERAAHILRQVAAALDFAHQRDVIHRDLKPGNVMIETGDRVTLTDFGIARARDETVVTRPQCVLGTPSYMAPEQALGQTVDHRADLYALGIVAYETLTGRLPYEADTPLGILHRQVYDAPPSLRAIRPDLPAALDRTIARVLAKNPAERFSSASEFVDALERAARPVVRALPSSDLTLPAPVGVVHFRPRRLRRRPALAVVAGLVVLAVAVSFVPPFPGVGSARPAPSPTPGVEVPAGVPAASSPNPGRAGTSPTPASSTSLPEGTIVFASDSPSNPGLFAITPGGQNRRELTSDDARNPVCSPAGDWAAFESKRSGTSLIYRVRLSSPQTVERVTSGSGSDQLAAWNPSGSSLVFSRARPGNVALVTIDLGDRRERQLTAGTGSDWHPSYAPDGGQLVFASSRTGTSELWLMNADGTNPRQLATGPGDKRDPAWSPDGRWIIFRSDRAGPGWDYFRVSPTSGQVARLTFDSSEKGIPSWSPDGHWIVFPASRNGSPQIFAMPAEGGAWIPIVSAPTIDGGAAWCR